MDLPPALAQAVLAGLGDAVVATDRDGIVTGWHGAAERLFGFGPAEVVGRPVTDLFPDAPARSIEEVGTLAGAPALDLILPVRRRGGGTVTSAVTVRPLLDAAARPAGTVAIFKPMGVALDPVHDLDRRRVNPEWDRALGGIVRELVEVAGSDPGSLEQTDALAKVLVAQARRMLPDCQVLLSLVPHDRQENFRIIAGAGAWGEAQVGREWPRAGTVAGLAMHLLRSIETVRLQERSNLVHTLAPGAIVAGRLVPLYTQAGLPDGRAAIGVLGFYRDRRHFFTPWERSLIREFCRLASLMLQGAELRAAMLRASERLRTTIDAAYQFTRSLAAEDQLQALVAVGLELGADRVTVLRVEEGEAEIIASADRLTGAAPVGARVPATAPQADDGTPVVARALELGRMVVCRDYRVEGLEPGAEGYFGSLRHAVVMPVAGIGTARVALVFARREDPRFAADDLATLQTVASICGVALRNAWLYAEVQEAGRVKTDFLNMAAHELRTPLTVIRGYLSMLRDASFGAVPEPLGEILRMLQAKTDELGRLVDDLLLAARLDTGRITLDPQPLDLNLAAQDAVERLRERALAAGAHLRVEPARRPVVVEAGAEQVGQILDALLANAVAYRADAPPWIRVAVSAGQGVGRLVVEDRGRGIAAADQARIFERFTRLDDERYPQEPGTGLGLYIARELALRQAGSLELEWSERDRGARFALSLPALDTGPDD